MIVYKWVVKDKIREGLYHSLINYGIYAHVCNGRNQKRIFKQPPYSLGINNYPYIDLIKHFSINKPNRRPSNIGGYHFWINPKDEPFWRNFNYCLKLENKKDIPITIIKCRINPEDIIFQNKEHIVAKKFEIIKEVLCK